MPGSCLHDDAGRHLPPAGCRPDPPEAAPLCGKGNLWRYLTPRTTLTQYPCATRGRTQARRGLAGTSCRPLEGADRPPTSVRRLPGWAAAAFGYLPSMGERTALGARTVEGGFCPGWDPPTVG